MDRAIVIVAKRIEAAELARLVRSQFGDMVKYVVDLRRGVAAIGGQLHADAEQLLMVDGSRQEDLWGANYYPAMGAAAVEFTAMINIRPSQGNRSMEIVDPQIRQAVLELTRRLLGDGEDLA